MHTLERTLIPLFKHYRIDFIRKNWFNEFGTGGVSY